MSEPAIGWISEVVLDGPDPWALARFWSGLLGGTPVEWYPGWVTLEPPPNGQRLSFQATTMAIIVAFTDPGDGESLRQAVRRLAGAA